MIAINRFVPVANNYYTLPVRNLGWHNIDKQVFDATGTRQTTDFNYKGKSSSVRYETWYGKLKDHQSYDRVYVYNLPQAFNSYVKLNANAKGGYTYELNADLTYETLVLAWKDDHFFYSQTSTNKGSRNH